MKVEWSHRPGIERESSPERCSLIFNLRSFFSKCRALDEKRRVRTSARMTTNPCARKGGIGYTRTWSAWFRRSQEKRSRAGFFHFFSGCLSVPLRSLTNNLSLFSKQTRGLTAGYRQVSAEEQVVERGASIRLRKILSFIFPLSLCHQYLSRNSLFSFFSPVSSF